MLLEIHNKFTRLTQACSASARTVTVVPVVNLNTSATLSRVFHDRPFTFSYTPDYPAGTMYVKMANDDKMCAHNRVQLTLTVLTRVRIELHFWGGEGHVNHGFIHWKDGWERSATKCLEFDRYKYGAVYTQVFDAGEIKLYGNGVSGHGTYCVFIVPLRVLRYIDSALSIGLTTRPERLRM